MKRPSPDTIKVLAALSRQYPALLEWLDSWYRHELENLPNLGSENVARSQGRCQVLKEVYDLIEKSPEYAAQSTP
jgi:hypothetical protein